MLDVTLATAIRLVHLRRFEEAKSLLRKQIPVAQRKLGDGHIITLTLCPVPLTVRGTQTLVSFAPLAFKLFYAARQNAVLRRSSFPSP